MNTYEFVRLSGYGRGDFDAYVNDSINQRVADGWQVHTATISNGDQANHPAVSILFEKPGRSDGYAGLDPGLAWRGKLYPSQEALDAAKTDAAGDGSDG